MMKHSSPAARRARLALLVAAVCASFGCDEEKPVNAAPSATAPEPEPEKPKAKEVPKAIQDFLAWGKEAGAAIAKGPDVAAAHPVLGKITCQQEKEAHDFGYCSAFKDGTPRFAAEWLQKEPSVWAAHMMQNSAASWVDCALLGQTKVLDSQEPNATMHHCKVSESEEIWVRHYEPPGAARNTEVYLFSKDFPLKDAEPPSAPRAMLYRNLNK